MTQKTKHRDGKLNKRRNIKDQNSFHKEKDKAKKTKKTKKKDKKNDTE